MLGLGYKGWQLSKQLKSAQCERCGLYHPKDAIECPHCAQLNESQLEEFKIRLLRQKENSKKLGRKFYLAAVIIVLLMIYMVVSGAG